MLKRFWDSGLRIKGQSDETLDEKKAMAFKHFCDSYQHGDWVLNTLHEYTSERGTTCVILLTSCNYLFRKSLFWIK